MKLSTVAVALSTPMLLAACATAQLSDLKEVQDKRGMLVTEPIAFVFGSSGVMMAGVEAGLLPGHYVATKENQQGTFYLGPGQCVWYKGQEKYSVITGGIWLPKTAENPARLFSIIGAPSSNPKTFEEAATLCAAAKINAPMVSAPGTDLPGILAGSPQALGIKPAGLNNTLTGTQIVGGALGIGIAQALADSAKGEYQIWQKVEDPVALRKMQEAVRRAENLQSK